MATNIAPHQNKKTASRTGSTIGTKYNKVPDDFNRSVAEAAQAFLAGVDEAIDAAFSLAKKPKVKAKRGEHSRVPAIAPPGQEYVDPYLFETGYFESREEYDRLAQIAKIKKRNGV